MWKWLHRVMIGVLVVSSVALNSLHLILPASPLHYFSVMPNQGWGKVRGIDVIRDGSTIIVASGKVVVAHQHPGDGYMRTKDWGGIVWGSGESMSRRYASREHYAVSLVQFEVFHIAILTAIYPAIFFFRSYRRRRVRRQALQPCSQCGYDLQGNESGVCPECGEPIASSSTTEVAG